VQYRGDDLEPARGPGLGCFRFQLIVLAVFVALAPLSVGWGWPPAVSAGLLFAVVILLLVTGQTIIFLLRLVAADRRGRRRPLASETRTVGELEEAANDPSEPEDPVRQ
jgi:fatty acid desaturase